MLLAALRENGKSCAITIQIVFFIFPMSQDITAKGSLRHYLFMVDVNGSSRLQNGDQQRAAPLSPPMDVYDPSNNLTPFDIDAGN